MSASPMKPMEPFWQDLHGVPVSNEVLSSSSSFEYESVADELKKLTERISTSIYKAFWEDISERLIAAISIRSRLIFTSDQIISSGRLSVLESDDGLLQFQWDGSPILSATYPMLKKRDEMHYEWHARACPTDLRWEWQATKI